MPLLSEDSILARSPSSQLSSWLSDRSSSSDKFVRGKKEGRLDSKLSWDSAALGSESMGRERERERESELETKGELPLWGAV